MPTPQSENEYPGERLGLPREGAGSIGTLGRRFGALLLDLGASALLAYAFFSSIDEVSGVRFANPWAANIIFILLQVLFIPTIGGSPGHRVFGLRIIRAGGGWPGLWRPIVRTLLLMLILPAVIWNADNRGLHDQVAGTVLVRS